MATTAKSSALADKHVLVIGGTSGIGLATCQLLIEQGAKVTAFGRSQEKCDNVIKLVDSANFSAQSLDILDRQALQRIFQEKTGFDHLICAATGGKRAVGPFLSMDMDGFQGSFDKLWGYSNAIRFGVPHLADKGSIVLLSGSPARKCKPGYVALSCVGGAVENLVRALANELAGTKKQQRINAVSPGLIDTPMFDAKGDGKAEFLRQGTASNPIPRPGTAMEVAKGVVFLLENEFVTGTVLDVDGGAVVP